MSFVIHFTNCVVACWDQFISLTVFFDCLWTVVYHCVVVLINWLIFFIRHIWLDGLTFCIHIVNINVTLRLSWFFLHFFIDVSDDWLRFVNFTFNWIRWFQVPIFVHFTYWVVTFRYDLVGLTVWSLDSVRFFTFLSGVIWSVIWWVWCVLTRLFDFLAIFINVSDDDLTLLRLCWGFLQFIYVGDILITFDDLTGCWVGWLEVTLIIHFTNCVVTCRY